MINIESGRYWDLPWSLVSGCTPCSPGCDHCWSAAMEHRFNGAKDPVYTTTTNGKFNGLLVFHTDRLSIPLKRKKPTVYAVWNDLFHEAVPDEFIAAALGIIASTAEHHYLVLTKRPNRMLEFYQWLKKCSVGANERYINHSDYRKGRAARHKLRDEGKSIGEPEPPTEMVRALYDIAAPIITPQLDKSSRFWRVKVLQEYHWRHWPLDNIWHGLTVCNQQEADEKIPVFLQIPGKKFLSIEPMLGEISLRWLRAWNGNGFKPYPSTTNHLDGLRQFDAVVLGGETGPGARPMHPDWVRSIRDQCAAAGVTFFLKNLGEWTACEEPQDVFNRNTGNFETIPAQRAFKRKKAGRTLDGRTHDDLPWAKGMASENV